MVTTCINTLQIRQEFIKLMKDIYGHDVGNELSQNTQEKVFLKLSGAALDNPINVLNSFRMQCMEYISKCVRILSSRKHAYIILTPLNPPFI